MKKTLLIAMTITLLFTFASSNAFAAGKWFNRNTLTGGCANCLDAIDGSSVGMDDTSSKAFVISNSMVYHYDLDLTSGATEVSPDVIAPDTNPGAKRWILIDAFAKIISSDTTFYVSTSGNDTTGNGTSGTPWATLGHAIKEVNNYYWDVSSIDVIISLADGTYTENDTITINHPCASSLTIQGNTTTNLSTSIAGVGANYITALGDLTSVFPTDSFCEIDGGNNNDGIWTVSSSSYSNPNTTINLSETLFDNTDSSGSVYPVAQSYGVILDFSSAATRGILIDSSSIKSIAGLMLKNTVLSGVGVYAKNNAFVSLSHMVVTGFETALKNESSVVTGAGMIAEGFDKYGYHITNNGFASLINSHAAHGVGTGMSKSYGYYIDNASCIMTTAASIGNDYNIYALERAVVYAATANNSSAGTYGWYAKSGAIIMAGSDVNYGNAVDYSPDASLALVPNFGNIGAWIYGGTETDDIINLHQLKLQEKSADSANPAEGNSVLWQSDGTGSGDDGDIMIKITAGGSTKVVTLIDFSTF